MIRNAWLTLILLFITNAFAEYTEHLTLRPLPRNNLLTSFLFESTSTPLPIDQFYATNATYVNKYSHYTTFPRSLGQLIGQSNTHELHLRFSQGWWDAESWGAQPNNGSRSGGIGVEIWAWVEGDNLENAVGNWNKLVNALSGFFCASLNFIDSAQTTFPVKSFESQGNDSNNNNNNNLYLLRGALPREPVCTENLTPFLKLLPCKGKAGISSLLDGHKIFDAQWQGMSVDVVPECKDGKCVHKMTQNIDAVIDVARAVDRIRSPVPKPKPLDQIRCNTSKSYYDEYKCFPLNEETQINWKLSDIFGRQINGKCSLAENNYPIRIDATANSWSASAISNDGLNVQHGDKFDIPKNSKTYISLSSTNSADVTPITTPPVYVERSFTGYGSDRGGMRSVFTNPSLTESVRFVYFETLPWYMRLYLHTLNVQYVSSDSTHEAKDVVQDLYYSPAIDRKQPSHIEIEIIIPPATTLAMSYDFDKSMLYLEEYPPDANRGFDIAPGVLTTLDTETPFSIRTTSLLLSLATPDFSMPYNVIILTCTVMALTFGTVFNLLAKDVVTDEEAEEAARQKPIAKIVKRFREKVAEIKDKLEGPKRGPYPYVDNDNDNKKKKKDEKDDESEKK